MPAADLQAIFDTLRGLMAEYTPPLVPKKDGPQACDLWSLKDIIVDGRRRKEVYFCGLVRYSTYVGFYFMPVYAEENLKAVFSPQLLALLKGKSCFHIRRLDESLTADIRRALQAGYQLYIERGWV